MSEVLKSDREPSSLDYFYNALQLRKQLTFLLLRDFGIKDKIRNIKNPLHGANKIEMWIIEHILKKYNCKGLVYMYPNWLLDYFRKNLLQHCQELIDNITIAHNINPSLHNETIKKQEAIEKRIYLDKALCNCEEIKQDLQFVISIVPVDANKFMPYITMLNKERDCLKRVRKKNNKFL